MTLLDQLEVDQTQIKAILQAHCEEELAPRHTAEAMRMIHEVYIETLQDALKTLNSLVEYLKKPN